ncbi:4'-phosphopantetheinyl transferase superfamily protein [Mesorhizobium sp. ES1-1]|uniref:4'-phosphopantetheinyl transferase superfamily protein n=1 Tax=Mesorhizobium sp. ES1-1 TaxID=2876629 RepID=UPI001CCFB631|nr:4'-phosphopantetheinyl transferase superfamily protein [Mesorhizobium sp. ES1-1]MBZ9674331.1 4'-phosphopantetheinyl transferase superfamily protein [Mesorhizobium sp. ES1-1]
MKQALDPNRIDVWYYLLDHFSAEDQSACLQLLSGAERQRHDAIHSQAAQHNFIAGRGLLRTVLSRYHGIEPRQWRFVANQYGRPSIDPQLGVADLHFNLSHTQGLVVCAVGPVEEIGVDVERRDRDVSVDDLAPAALAPAELLRFRLLRHSDRRDFFFTRWTLKEAYVKARGIGLSLPLKELSLDFAGVSPVISFTDAVDDEEDRWRLWSLRPTQDHIVGLAIASPVAPLGVRFQRLRRIHQG